MTAYPYEIQVHGIVQGVGFRPFIYRLAHELGLSGMVRNTESGVLIHLFCGQKMLSQFLETLQGNAPPMARIMSVEWDISVPKDYDDFTIEASTCEFPQQSSIPKDSAVCNKCLKELFDPQDRRFNYPFITCTNCGPRYTIIESLPYDRPNTSMKRFPLCERCQQEYNDPNNRRFHAQPVGCWSCGPELSLHDRSGILVQAEDPIIASRQALLAGKVLAIKGLGGFHLAVNATNKKAVARLRGRKKRPSKPFALMARDINEIKKYCQVAAEEEAILQSPEAPILLLRKKAECLLPDNVAPRMPELGIMMPHTPLQHLLFNEKLPLLVMTSGNKTGEPVCIDNKEAFTSLSGIADFYLVNNRPIVSRLDDSIIRFAAGRRRFLRRARGFVPEPISVEKSKGVTLSCGAMLKNTFCLARGSDAFVSQHIGDMESSSGFDFFVESFEHMRRVHDMQPDRVVVDLHPDYVSSRYGKSLQLPVLAVQHHHAHAAAVAAEFKIQDPYYALIFDGAGQGNDQTVWGGELLFCKGTGFDRIGSLQHLRLPGGDAAAREPWRMAVSLLYLMYGNDLNENIVVHDLPGLEKKDVLFLLQMIQKEVNCPLTSSCGRLFDAVSALVGQRRAVEFEGQAAMELEGLAWRELADRNILQAIQRKPAYEVSFYTLQGRRVLRLSSLCAAILNDLKQGVSPGSISLKFHLWLILASVDMLGYWSSRKGRYPVILAGGCMQNRLLLEGLWTVLHDKGFTLYSGENIPVNDGGISFGQAIIGGKFDVSCYSHAGA